MPQLISQRNSGMDGIHSLVLVRVAPGGEGRRRGRQAGTLKAERMLGMEPPPLRLPCPSVSWYIVCLCACPFVCLPVCVPACLFAGNNNNNNNTDANATNHHQQPPQPRSHTTPRAAHAAQAAQNSTNSSKTRAKNDAKRRSLETKKTKQKRRTTKNEGLRRRTGSGRRGGRGCTRFRRRRGRSPEGAGKKRCAHVSAPSSVHPFAPPCTDDALSAIRKAPHHAWRDNVSCRAEECFHSSRSSRPQVGLADI